MISAAREGARGRREWHGRERERLGGGGDVKCEEKEPGRQLRAGVHGVGHRFPSAYWQEEEDGYAPGGLGQNRDGPARGAR